MDLNQEELTEVINNNDVVVVDFWATWCGPCRVLGPTYIKFAEANDGVSINKIDIEANPLAAQSYLVRSIPTVLYFKGGVEVARMTGNQTQESLQAKLEEVTNG